MLNKYLIALFLLTNNILANCTYSHQECIEPGDTRVIDGVPVTLPCWRERHIYTCKEDSDNNCSQLRDQGCSSIKQTCRSRPDGLCAVQDEILSCPVERCDEAGTINCAKNLFCVGASCVTIIPTKNNNFDKTASSLAALADAAKQISAQQTRDITLRFIFKGRSMECNDAWAGAIDCCSDNPSGWAKGLFASCDEECKQLAQARFSGRAIYAGSYCNNRIPLTNICASRHQVYCVFDSKIARIVQTDGRHKQLGRSFWLPGDDDSSHSDCSGLSITELQKLDFSQMNFQDIFEEVRTQVNKIDNKLVGSVLHDETLKQKAINYSPEQLQARNPEPKVAETNSRTTERLKDFYERFKK